MVRVHPDGKPHRTMEPRNPHVQAVVQQLVMEHGEYSPIELLLATNRLGYEDFRAWREGRLGRLGAVLAGGPHEVRAWSKGRNRGQRRSVWTASRW